MADTDSFVLHVCCAPCLATALETIRRSPADGVPVPGAVFFYNPNIHPLIEFRRRCKALRVYLERDPVSAEIDDTYGLLDYLRQVAGGGGAVPDRRERCYRCYRMRLGKTAALTAGRGQRRFTTTLLASREQDRDLVAEAGREAARDCGVEFVEADLRRHLAPETLMRGIYKQQYCGCIFSEDERFRTTSLHLYPARERERKGENPLQAGEISGR